MEESIISGAGDRGRPLRPLPHTEALIAHKCLFFAPGARHKSAYSLQRNEQALLRNMKPKNAHKCMFLMEDAPAKYAFFSKNRQNGAKNAEWRSWPCVCFKNRMSPAVLPFTPGQTNVIL